LTTNNAIQYYDIRTEISTLDSASFHGKCMIIPTSVDGQDVICTTSSVKWADIALDNIIASVTTAPAVNPWEWSKGMLKLLPSLSH